MVRVYEDAGGVIALVYDRSGSIKNVVTSLGRKGPGMDTDFLRELVDGDGLPNSRQYNGAPFSMQRVEEKAVSSCNLIAETRWVKTTDGEEGVRLTLYPDAMGKHGERLFGIVRRHEASACAVIDFQKAVNQ